MDYHFKVEIILSEAQLKVISEMGAGVFDGHLIKPYQEMAIGQVREHLIDADPNISGGLGADINDILAIGFQALNHIDQGHKTKVKTASLCYHPFRKIIPKIKSITLYETTEQDNPYT